MDLKRLFLTLVALAAWFGLGVQFYVTQTSPNLASISTLERTFRYLEYFTVLTNLLVAITATISTAVPASRIGRLVSTPSFQSAMAVYIALVGLVYNVILQGLHEFEGLAALADRFTHDVVPIVYVLYWLTCVTKGALNWKMPITWTIYPIAYALYALAIGGSTGRYPYPFLDVGQLGMSAVILNIFLLSVAFLFLGEVFVAADKLIARFATKTTPIG